MYSATAVVTTEIVIPGLVFPEFEYVPPCPSVTKIILSLDGQNMRGKLFLRDVPSTEELRHVATSAYECALRRLECQFEFLSGQSRWAFSSIVDQDNPIPGITILCGVGNARANGCNALVTQSMTAADLLPIVQAPLSLAKRDLYFELFYHARTSDHPVVQFLGHYQIISLIEATQENKKNTKQRHEQQDIDSFFRSLGVSESSFVSKPPRKGTESKGTESIYTFLRNAVMHERRTSNSGMPMNQRDVKDQMNDHLPDLRRLTRKAILGSPC
jgi:hypothetical protein